MPMSSCASSEGRSARAGSALRNCSTGLGIVLKRIDTGSCWILLNNSRSAYWETPDDGEFVGNRHFRLANLIRASAAAPHYFDPELIAIVEGRPPGLFLDGAVTPHNNPSLALFLTAVLPAYGLNWALGADQLRIVSIGTGTLSSDAQHRGGTPRPSDRARLDGTVLADRGEPEARAAPDVVAGPHDVVLAARFRDRRRRRRDAAVRHPLRLRAARRAARAEMARRASRPVV